jgi:hypothetical protein
MSHRSRPQGFAENYLPPAHTNKTDEECARLIGPGENA